MISTRTGTTISVRNLSYAYLDPESQAQLPVLSSVSFDVAQSELVCIVGPSGCGKTTLLRILAGFIHPLQGTLEINGHPIDGPSPERILLFQELHLFYWMTVVGNVEFALEARGVPKPARRPRALDVIEFVGLDGFERYYPHQLSGGMRQRLGLARAFAAEPAILLMDEPFGSLDVEARSEMESEFLALHEAKKFTAIVVTHDVRQAVFLGGRIFVMSHRPASINLTVTVPFARPRQSSIRQTTEFHALEDSLSSQIRSGD